MLSVLNEATAPMCASDIYAKADREGGRISLSTVYRILELFVSEGIALKSMLMGSEMAVYSINRFEHKHYAVCTSCHKIVPMANCPMEKFIPKLQDNNFLVLGHKIEMYGYCRDCITKKK